MIAVTNFLLIPAVLGILTIDELYKSVHKPLNDSNNNAYINPDGPLNLLHGYISYENRLIHKKRLFSPGFKINYSLTRTGCQLLFKRNNTKDAVTKFKISNNEDISIYLSQYYRAARAMYNVVNGEANIHTNRDNSLFRFLTQKLNKEDSFKLLATMLLLAEGVDLPVELVKKTIDLDGSQVKPMDIQVLIYKGNDKSLLEIEIYNVIKRERRDVQGKIIYIEENRRTLKEVVKLVQFFIEYGGKNKEKVEFYKLTPDDTPSFLIRSYIFEFIQNLEETQLFFKVVNDLILYTMNGKDNEVWKEFFTENREMIKKCEPVYEALKTINSLILGMGFPFSDHIPPPSNMMVNGYDRKNKIATTGNILRFSDCCDITIYTLFCCLLYNPASRAYELDHLNNYGYTPSNDLQYFFTEVCPKPERLTSLHIHQQWTHVVQDLVLSEGELMGKKATGSNTIEYCKEENGVFAEIKPEILNMLKVIAKVTGMPEDKMKELGKIDAMVQSDEIDIGEIREHIKEYATKIFNDISVMLIEIDINNMELLTVNDHKRLYGEIIIKFRPECYNGGYGSEHAVQFMLKQGHADATVISDRNEIKKEDKGTLETLSGKCKEMESDLGRIGMNKIREFLSQSQGKFKPVSPEMVEKVEQACSDIERYLAINKILNSRRMETIDDKLYFIDLFAPYLNKITKNDNSNMREQANKETALDSINAPPRHPREFSNRGTSIRNGELQPNDPLVILISNILGSVSLDDEATQFFYTQIFASCNRKYKELFPNISGNIRIAPEIEIVSFKDLPYYLLLMQFHEHDAPNMLNKLYNKLRKARGNLFLKNIEKYLSMYSYTYVPMVKKCIKSNCSTGIKAIKNDFGIKEGKMASGEDLLSRFYAWLDIVLKTGYTEGLEEICSIWKNILNGETDRLGSALFIFFDNRLLVIRWTFLYTFIFKNLYENEKYIDVLLEIVLYSTYGFTYMKYAYDMFESQFTVSLCRSLMTSLENIVNDMNKYLAILETSYIENKIKLSTEECERITTFNKSINGLKGFINQVAQSVTMHSTRDTGSENREAFTNINICIKIIDNDISKLENRGLNLRNKLQESSEISTY
ncbi:hypothetical protein PAEPH01_1543 [Pancytospora epiphaga]|nr:hypothetical protein PAEPH01_1543 [Pancytospora epiphaga]